jgi:hypothetical protein
MNTPIELAKSVDSLAWNIARRLAQMHEHGRAQLKRGGKTVSRSNAKAHAGKRHTVKAYQGTGIRLPEQDVLELQLAARAAILGKLMATDCPLESAWITGAKAARRTLYMATREPIFATTEASERALDKARFANQQELDREAMGEAKAARLESSKLDFLSHGEEAIEPRKLILPLYTRAKRACVAHWMARKAAAPYNALQMHLERDLKTLRAHAKALLAGNLPTVKTKREDAAGYKQQRELSARMESGFALLNPAPLAPAMEEGEWAHTRFPKQAAQTDAFAIGFSETWEENLRQGLNPIASRILGNAKPTQAQMQSLVALFQAAKP